MTPDDAVVVAGVALACLCGVVMKLVDYYFGRSHDPPGGRFRADWTITSAQHANPYAAPKPCAYCGAAPCGCGAESGASAWVGTTKHH